MDKWDAQLTIEAFGHSATVHLTNEWGRNYPSFIDELMPDLLDIRPEHRVLDVGGGQYPFQRAMVSVDAYIDDDMHRQGKRVERDRRLVAGLAERLPLRDGAFDFVITRHTMEHVTDPEAVAREMTRVARRGFSDSPNSIWEPMLGFPPHLWLIDVEDGALVFRRRPWVRAPLGNPLRPFWWYDPPVRYDFELRYRNVFNAQYLWDGEMRVRVEDDGTGFDYDDPVQAAEAHLDFALNALRAGRVPADEVTQDIAMALRHRPDWALAHNTKGVLLWQAGRTEEARAAFRRAAEIEPDRAEFRENAGLTTGGAPRLVFLPEDEPPSYPDRARLARDLRIGPKTKLLEITDDEHWYPQSDVAAFREDGTLSARRDRYDVVIARAGLAEAADLPALFRRLEALAPRGYVEMPSRMTAAFESDPSQKWFLERFGAGVRACGRPTGDSPCRHILAALRRADPRVDRRIRDNTWGVARTGHVWDGTIDIPIVPGAYDPAEPGRRADADTTFQASLSRLGLGAERFPITVIVHTRNEERNVEDCLRSVHGWAGEIIVMDMESTDRTREIAARYADRVLTHPHMQICEPARNAALEAANHEWALYLDADERMTPELRTRIKQFILRDDGKISAVQLPYKNIVFGKWIRHTGGWWPGFKAPMLVRKGKVRFQSEIHSMPLVEGGTARLNPSNEREAVVHHSYPSVREWIEKANRFTDHEAEAMRARGAAPDWRAAARAFGECISLFYDRSEGKRDGLEGWMLSLCAGMYELFSHVKHWEASRSSADTSDALPPDTAAFLAAALEAARTGEAPREAGGEPDWLFPLLNMLRGWDGRKAGVFAGCPNTESRARQAGWKADKDVSKAAAAVVWHIEDLTADALSNIASRAKPGTPFLIGFPSSIAPSVMRGKLETLFGATVHLLDPEPECGRFAAMLWSGERVTVRRRVLLTLHSNAMRMMGGGEAVAFQSLLKATRAQGVQADVSVSLRLKPDEYDLIHVVSLFQPDHAAAIRSWGKPTMVMPIYWDGPRVQWVTAVLPLVLSPERSEAEREKLLSLYARRELKADGVGVEDARWPDAAADALRAVRDCGARMIATGPQELEETARALGPAAMGTASIRLGIETERFRGADERAFVEAFGLRDFVLCLGRVEPMKNQLMLAYALRGTGRKLVLMGGAPDPNYLALCKYWGGEGLIHIPPQPPEMVASALGAAACHALPSWWEVPGLVSIEAAAAGCPVVAADCGTIRHYLGDDIEYCDPADPESIRRAVLAACGERGSEKTRRLRERCLTDYGHETCAAAYRLAYDLLLAGEGVRVLALPDWNRPETWQPVVRGYMDRARAGSDVTLCLLVDEPTGASAEDAARLLEGFCESEGMPLSECGDIELTDLASAGAVAAVLATGSEAERSLAARFGFQPVDWREAWTEQRAS